MNKVLAVIFIFFLDNTPLTHCSEESIGDTTSLVLPSLLYLRIDIKAFRPYQTESDSGTYLHIPRNATFTRYRPLAPQGCHCVFYKINVSKINPELWKPKTGVDALELTVTTLPAGSYREIDSKGIEIVAAKDEQRTDPKDESASRNSFDEQTDENSLMVKQWYALLQTRQNERHLDETELEDWRLRERQTINRQPLPTYNPTHYPYDTEEDTLCCCCYCLCCMDDDPLETQKPTNHAYEADRLLTY